MLLFLLLLLLLLLFVVFCSIALQRAFFLPLSFFLSLSLSEEMHYSFRETPFVCLNNPPFFSHTPIIHFLSTYTCIAAGSLSVGGKHRSG